MKVENAVKPAMATKPESDAMAIDEPVKVEQPPQPLQPPSSLPAAPSISSAETPSGAEQMENTSISIKTSQTPAQPTERAIASPTPPTPTPVDHVPPPIVPTPAEAEATTIPEATPATPADPAESLSLPPSLDHLSHPPTKILYISNLRRPFTHDALHEFLGPSSLPIEAHPPHANTTAPGLWLSGVKDHAYAGFLSAQAALDVAIRINEKVWPEGMGAALAVQFVDPSVVSDLIAREEDAWKSRQKLVLVVEKAGDGWKFNLDTIGSAPGRLGSLASQPPPRVPIADTGPIRVPPRGPAADRYAPYERNGREDRRGLGPIRRTRTRPYLSWREGPGRR